MTLEERVKEILLAQEIKRVKIEITFLKHSSDHAVDPSVFEALLAENVGEFLTFIETEKQEEPKNTP